MGGLTLAAAQISQFMKFDEMSETSIIHGGHSLAGSVQVPLLGLRLIMMAWSLDVLAKTPRSLMWCSTL